MILKYIFCGDFYEDLQILIAQGRIIIRLVKETLRLDKEILQGVNKMTATEQDLLNMISELKAEVGNLNSKTNSIKSTVEALLVKVPASPDYQAEVDAVKAIIGDVKAAEGTLDAAEAEAAPAPTETTVETPATEAPIEAAQ